MTLPQRTTTVPTSDEIARAAHLAAEQLTNPKYVAGYLGGEMQALLRKFPDEPGIRACTALWVAHVRATVHGPVADQRANAAVLRHLRSHDDRPPAALRQEFPAELGESNGARWVDADLAEQDAWANGWDADDNGIKPGGAR